MLAFTVSVCGGHGLGASEFPLTDMVPPTLSTSVPSFAASSFQVPLAVSTQEQIDDTTQREMDRLLNGGRHPEQSSDFILYVIIPMLICFGLIVILRRMFS